jgi:NDP-sugar pyrophosphorylase family protein
MLPLTRTVPKAMLEVAGRPFVDWQLEKLASCGYDDVVFCVAHLGDQIRAHVADGSHFGLRVRYSDEGPSLRGTAGAVRRAYTQGILDPLFLLTYGDSWLPFDYAEPLAMLAAHDDCDGVMSIYKNEGRWDGSNVQTDGEWILRYQKGGSEPSLDHIDYGATALRRDVVLTIPEDRAWGLDTVQTDLAGRHRLRAHLARERFYEIGSVEGLRALSSYLSSPSARKRQS